MNPICLRLDPRVVKTTVYGIFPGITTDLDADEPDMNDSPKVATI